MLYCQMPPNIQLNRIKRLYKEKQNISLEIKCKVESFASSFVSRFCQFDVDRDVLTAYCWCSSGDGVDEYDVSPIIRFILNVH